MAKPTGILHWSHENGFADPMIATEQHMSAYSCLGWRSAFHWRGFETPSSAPATSPTSSRTRGD